MCSGSPPHCQPATVSQRRKFEGTPARSRWNFTSTSVALCSIKSSPFRDTRPESFVTSFEDGVNILVPCDIGGGRRRPWSSGCCPMWDTEQWSRVKGVGLITKQLPLQTGCFPWGPTYNLHDVCAHARSSSCIALYSWEGRQDYLPFFDVWSSKTPLWIYQAMMVGLVLIWGEPVFVCLPTFQFFSRAIAQACRTTQWLRTWPQSGESWERFISHVLPSWLQEQLLFNACLQIHLATDWQLSIPSRSLHPQLLGVPSLSSKAWDDVLIPLESMNQGWESNSAPEPKGNICGKAQRSCACLKSLLRWSFKAPFLSEFKPDTPCQSGPDPTKTKPTVEYLSDQPRTTSSSIGPENWPPASTTLWAMADFS